MSSGVRIGGRMRVLLVDDDPDALEVLKTLLEMDGRFSVRAARSGHEALRLVESEIFKAAAADYRMPKMDGLRLIEMLRATRRNLPVALMTAYGDDRLAREAKSRGASAVLFKPFPVGRLVEAFENMSKPCLKRKSGARS